MKFIDSTEIRAIAGSGGDGIVSFQAAFRRPKMGPDGGNGGNGGDVFLEGNPNLNTLCSLRYREVFRAESGTKGGPNNRTGKCGESRVLPVPLGTKVFDVETGQDIGEVTKPGERLLVAKGGKRGYGNLSYATPTCRAPRTATQGRPGDECNLRLELKLFADIGLAGFPNAGKSSLLRKISAACPKVADYPFTTLIPHLGVVDPSQFGLRDQDSFVVADIPGLIEGASAGRGLGFRFLRHLERTQIIAYVIDAFSVEDSDALAAFSILRNEVRTYSPELADKPGVIVINKTDLAPLEMDVEAHFAALFADSGYPVRCVSAINGHGIKECITLFRMQLTEFRGRVGLDTGEVEGETWMESHSL